MFSTIGGVGRTFATMFILVSCSDPPAEPDPPMIRFNPGLLDDDTFSYGVWRRHWPPAQYDCNYDIPILDCMKIEGGLPTSFSAYDAEKSAGFLMLLIRAGNLSEETIAEDFERRATNHLLGSYADDCESGRQQIMFLVTKVRTTHAFVREGKLIIRTENNGSASEN
jgi:hypothetical protein